MTISVWSYLKEYEAEKKEVFSAIEKVMNSGRLILGESVSGFESRFASYCGAKHGIGVNSCTDALFLGLKALGVGPGHEVITVSNTAVPTVSAIVSTGATARFVDIHPDTYLMDTSQLESDITSKTKCIIPVHIYGQCVDMDEVLRIAKKHGLSVLEDCAQSTGATYKGQVSGSMSDLSAFSFYPTKILGGYGDGGMVLTSSKELDAKLRKLRYYGMETTYYAVEHGYNSRLDELHAEILLRKLVHLDRYIARRKVLAEQYGQLLKDTDLILPVTAPGNSHAYYIYPVRHPRRDEIMAELKKNDIIVNISYPWPIHTMTGYQHLGYQEGDLPHTEKTAKQVFSLPMYPMLTDDEQRHVCATLKKILK